MFAHLFHIRLAILIDVRLELGVYLFHAIEIVAFVTKSKKFKKHFTNTTNLLYDVFNFIVKWLI